MEIFQKQAEHILKSELTDAGLEISSKEGGREGVHFLVKNESGRQFGLYLQSMNLIAQQSVKIPKEQLGVPREDLWVALTIFSKDDDPWIFLIPSPILADPDDFIFFENNVGQFSYLSNWEIKVFSKGMDKLDKYFIYNQMEKLLF